MTAKQKNGLEIFLPLTAEEKDRIRAEIIANCDLVADCWVYRTRNSAGYGMKWIDGKMLTTSRFMLAYSTRESLNVRFDACHIPECPYKACCNPLHLFWGSHKENCEQRERMRRELLEGFRAVSVPFGYEVHIS